MGTARLDLRKLIGLLERIKVECVVEADDLSHNHCVLRQSNRKQPGAVGMLEYINQGVEPRSVGIKVEPLKERWKTVQVESYFWITDEVINLRG